MSRKAELMNRLSNGDTSVTEELKELMAKKPEAKQPAPKAEAPKPAEEPSKEEKEEDSSDWKKKKK